MAFDIFQQGQANAGGWRYPYGGQTSVDALYKPMGIDSEFLRRVSGQKSEADKPKGLIDQATQATPLTGLIEAGGNDQAAMTTAGESFGKTPGGNLAKDVSGWGYEPSMSGAAKGGATGGILGALLGGLMGGKTLAPVQDLVAPGFNGYGSNDYGRDMGLSGPPNEAQAQSLANELAAALAQYDVSNGGGLMGGVDNGYGGNSGGGLAGQDGSIGGW